MAGGHLVIFAVGKDRPGIVAGVSKVLYQLGCNIEDSSMTILKNQFAMILIVAPGPETEKGELEAKLKEASRELGLRITLNEVGGEELDTSMWDQAQRYILTVFGADKAGIVYNVSRILAERRINIANVKTKMILREEGNIYAMILEIDIPLQVDTKELQGALENTAKELDVDINLREIPTARM